MNWNSVFSTKILQDEDEIKIFSDNKKVKEVIARDLCHMKDEVFQAEEKYLVESQFLGK